MSKELAQVDVGDVKFHVAAHGADCSLGKSFWMYEKCQTDLTYVLINEVER